MKLTAEYEDTDKQARVWIDGDGPWVVRERVKAGERHAIHVHAGDALDTFTLWARWYLEHTRED